MKIAKVFLVFLLISVFFFSGCAKANEKDFYGKWQNRRDAGLLTIDISAESIKGQYSEGSSSSYTIEGLIWLSSANNDPVTKNEYSKGYIISGTVAQVENISDINLGEQVRYEFYINKDKTKVYRKTETGGAALSDYIFSKANSSSQSNSVISSLSSQTDGKLNGTWVDDDDSGWDMRFNDGKFERYIDGYLFYEMTYTTSGGKLTFIDDDGEEYIEDYSISGNQLTITSAGITNTYTKKSP